MATGGAVSARALRPLRRPRLPRRHTLLRAGLAAALLGLAAAVLHTPAGCPPAAPGSRPAPTGLPAGSAGGPAAGADTSGADGPGAGRGDGSTGPARGDASPPPASPGEDRSGGTAPGGAGRPGGPGPWGDEGAAPGGRPAPLPVPSGAVGVPVRLAEPAALAVLRPGARVDLLAVPAAGGAGTLLASRALVLDVVGADALDAGAALYLALPPDQARRAVSQPEGSRFAIVVRE
ncbi:hypothetical protein ACVCAH_06160 [Micromonospora sp. LZ34]